MTIFFYVGICIHLSYFSANHKDLQFHQNDTNAIDFNTKNLSDFMIHNVNRHCVYNKQINNDPNNGGLIIDILNVLHQEPNSTGGQQVELDPKTKKANKEIFLTEVYQNVDEYDSMHTPPPFEDYFNKKKIIEIYNVVVNAPKFGKYNAIKNEYSYGQTVLLYSVIIATCNMEMPLYTAVIESNNRKSLEVKYQELQAKIKQKDQFNQNQEEENDEQENDKQENQEQEIKQEKYTDQNLKQKTIVETFEDDYIRSQIKSPILPEKEKKTIYKEIFQEFWSSHIYIEPKLVLMAEIRRDLTNKTGLKLKKIPLTSAYFTFEICIPYCKAIEFDMYESYKKIKESIASLPNFKEKIKKIYTEIINSSMDDIYNATPIRWCASTIGIRMAFIGLFIQIDWEWFVTRFITWILTWGKLLSKEAKSKAIAQIWDSFKSFITFIFSIGLSLHLGRFIILMIGYDFKAKAFIISITFLIEIWQSKDVALPAIFGVSEDSSQQYSQMVFK